MRVLFLSDPNSTHTIKWSTSLAREGLEITVIGMSSLRVADYQGHDNIEIVTLGEAVTRREGAVSKAKYLKALPVLRRQLRSFRPDVLHAHYASSYALIGALSGFHPFVVSVWGSDIFSFPRRSPLHRAIMGFNLRRADRILATSHALARETQEYTAKRVAVTPFGIDTQAFKPEEVESFFDRDDIVVGTIKALEAEYGIEQLIRAFALIRQRNETVPLKLLIVGGGSLETQLKELSGKLGIGDMVVFTGRVEHARVAQFHNMISVFVAVSESESFGVAVLEACACERPVVVSNVGGLPEVVQDGVTGFVVPRGDVAKTSEAIERLVLDEELRRRMGRTGRQRVLALYDWKDSVALMIETYGELLSS